jgi:hypothetical protein
MASALMSGTRALTTRNSTALAFFQRSESINALKSLFSKRQCLNHKATQFLNGCNPLRHRTRQPIRQITRVIVRLVKRGFADDFFDSHAAFHHASIGKNLHTHAAAARSETCKRFPNSAAAFIKVLSVIDSLVGSRMRSTCERLVSNRRASSVFVIGVCSKACCSSIAITRLIAIASISSSKPSSAKKSSTLEPMCGFFFGVFISSSS